MKEHDAPPFNGLLLQQYRQAGDVHSADMLLSDLAVFGAAFIRTKHDGRIPFNGIIQYVVSTRRSYDLTDHEAVCLMNALTAIAKIVPYRQPMPSFGKLSL